MECVVWQRAGVFRTWRREEEIFRDRRSEQGKTGMFADALTPFHAIFHVF